MTIIPNQFFGLGDIIFTQTLVRRIAKGNPIVWPVFPQFVDQLNRAYPDITFVDWRDMRIEYGRTDQHTFEHEELGDCTVLPLRFASEILGGNYTTWMSDKYKLYGMDYNDWVQDAKWLRDGLRELELKKQVSVYTDNREYKLINNTFGSDGDRKVGFKPGGYDYMEVHLENIQPYSLFDWQEVIQNASAIHTVNTSIIYLLEMLDLKAKEVHLYQRSITGQTFAGIDYLLKRHKYIFHG